MITKEWKLPEVIGKFPATRGVFDRYGLHGCGGANGPSESIEFFSQVHRVPLERLIAELEAAKDSSVGPAPYIESLEDMLYRRFFRAAIVVILTAGATLGAVVLFLYGVRGTFTALDLFGAVQGHANAQIFGWVGLFVMGFAIQGFPRFKYVRLWRPDLAGVSFVLMVVGLVVRAAASFVPWVWLGATGGALEAAAIVLFLVVMGKTLRASETKDPWDKFVYASLACFLLSGLLEPILYVAIFSAPSTDVLIHRVATFQGPYRDIQILGFAGLMILGVSQRILPTAFGFREPGRLASGASFWLLTGGLALDITAWLAFRATRHHVWAIASWGGGVLYAVGAMWLVVAMRALGRGGSDRSSKFIRAAYFWLAVACVMIVAEPFYTRAVGVRFSHAFHGAIRHAFTVGFISLMILGVSSKVVPILRGIDLQGLPALWAPFLLINLGNTLRVGSQVATDLTARAFPIMGVSGVFEVLGLALWGVHLWSLLGRQTVGSTSGEITADSKAAAVIDAHPETLEVFEKFGFKELRNPILRNTIARRVTLRTAAELKKVDLEAFLAALKEKAK